MGGESCTVLRLRLMRNLAMSHKEDNTLLIVHHKELSDIRLENNKMQQELIMSKHESNVT